jgi:hypothetical protein
VYIAKRDCVYSEKRHSKQYRDGTERDARDTVTNRDGTKEILTILRLQMCS